MARSTYTIHWWAKDRDEHGEVTFTPLESDTDLMSAASEHVARVEGLALNEIDLPQIEEVSE